MANCEEVCGYYVPSALIVGIGAAKDIPGKIKAFGGSKSLVVTDKGRVVTVITKQIINLLEDAGVKYVVYDDTIPSPADKNDHDGVEVYKKEKCDSLITIGGGSARFFTLLIGIQHIRDRCRRCADDA